MVSLESTAKKLTKQKQETSKIRRYSEREFQKAKLLSRKYSSSLSSIQKRVATSREQIEDISHVLNQKISQLQSVQRLKNAAEEWVNKIAYIHFNNGIEETKYNNGRIIQKNIKTGHVDHFHPVSVESLIDRFQRVMVDKK